MNKINNQNYNKNISLITEVDFILRKAKIAREITT